MTEPSPETVLYQDDKAMISDRRIILSGTTYSLANVTSVTSHIVTGSRAPALVAGLAGAAIVGCLGSTSEWSPAITVILILACIAGGAFLSGQVKDSYAVRIGTAGGESNVLIAPDKAYIEKVVEAINKAMVRRS